MEVFLRKKSVYIIMHYLKQSVFLYSTMPPGEEGSKGNSSANRLKTLSNVFSFHSLIQLQAFFKRFLQISENNVNFLDFSGYILANY